MKKYFAYAVAVIPGLLPDTLTLASDWSYVGTALTGALLLVVYVMHRRDREETQLSHELVAPLVVAFCLSAAFSIHRAAAGITATAQVFPDGAEAIASAVGSEQRLAQMQADINARFNALERIAVLESLLAEQERKLAAQERDLAQRERNAQEDERALQTAERALAEAERLAQERARMLQSTERALADAERAAQRNERAARQDAREQQRDLLTIASATNVWADTDVPGFISKYDTAEIGRWRMMRADQLVLKSDPLSFAFHTGRPRNLELIIGILRTDGTVVWADKFTLPAQDAQKFGVDDYFATVTSAPLSLNAAGLVEGPHIECAAVQDSDSGERWDFSGVSYYELKVENIEADKQLVNKLPETWSWSHPMDKSGFRDQIARFCAF